MPMSVLAADPPDIVAVSPIARQRASAGPSSVRVIAPLVRPMGGDERVGRLGDDVDDGVAQAEDVVAALGHRALSVKLGPGALLQVQG